ncbi:MAG TPA: hypothetical protein VGR96_07540 [Acidobacteriaceae bacterium]|nr:hypothetical protein [Acidobacteriaceae bacterium]
MVSSPRSLSRIAARFTVLALCSAALSAGAASVPVPADLPQTSLPDAATLLRDVEAHQKQLDKARENYTFRAVRTMRRLDKNGSVKGVETEEDEVFFVNGHRVQRLVRRNGKDLTPDQAAKEQARVNKEVQKDLQPGQENADRDEITVSRLLQIVKFSHPRRVSLNGRNTIVFDFVGDPHAKTHGRSEEALRKVSGTVWVDERDHEVSRMSATLDDNYRVGFGFLASVAKGSNLVFDQMLIRNEAWLPTAIALHLQAKALLVMGVRADVDIRFDDYRKFQADAVQQPGATVLEK